MSVEVTSADVTVASMENNTKVLLDHSIAEL